MDWDFLINIGMIALGCSFIIVAIAQLLFKNNDNPEDSDIVNQENMDEQAQGSAHYMDFDFESTGDDSLDMFIATSHVQACCYVAQLEIDKNDR